MLNLKYFEGAQPSKKRKSQGADRKDQKKAYEKSREREFKVEWKTGRPWLQFDGSVVYCSSCREAGVSPSDTVYVKGSTSLRKDGIKTHETAECHIKAEAIIRAKSTPVHQTAAAKSLIKLKQANYDSLVIKMRNAHAIAKHNMSFKSYEVLCRLDKMKGLDVGTQYLTDKAAATMCSSIADVCRNGVVNDLSECQFCSLTCDGSTDFMGEELETLYVRLSYKDCRISDKFMYIGTASSGRSEDIFTFIKDTFKTLNIEETMTKKLVGFCADGASNMQGSKTGLAALIRKDWPHLIFMHCLAHRLELAFKDAIKKTTPSLYEKATALLIGLYYLFKKSPKQKKGLQRMFEAMGQPQVLPTRVGGTRWLPHYKRALQVFEKSYKVVRLHLENSSHENAKAEGLARMMRDGPLITYLLSMKRIITTLSSLSLFLQRPEVSIADAYTRVKSTATTLHQSLSREDNTVSPVLESKTYQGESLTFRAKPSEKETAMTECLISALESRFPTSEFASATAITSFRNWPILQPDEVKVTTYGEEEVKTVFQQFESILASEDVSLDELIDEWATLRSLVYEKFSKELESATLTWPAVHRDLAACDLSNIFKMVSLLMALPPTSVNNETAFSAMKLLKTKRRGRLSHSRLNDLMTVKLVSEDIETFQPDAALNHWMYATPSGQKRRKPREKRHRRETTKPATVQSTPEAESVSSEEEDEEQENRDAVAALMKDAGIYEEESSDEEAEMNEEECFSLILSFRE